MGGIANDTTLTGIIVDIKSRIAKDPGLGTKTSRINIKLRTIRRPFVAPGNVNPIRDWDSVIDVRVDEPGQIRYCEENLKVGDGLHVRGMICCRDGRKSFICQMCGETNEYPGTITFVAPKQLYRLSVIDRRYEIIKITEEEHYYPEKKLQELLEARKTFKGKIIKAVKIADRSANGGLIPYEVMIHDEPSEAEITAWFQQYKEESNLIYVAGHLTSDPMLEEGEHFETVCKYSIAIDRQFRVFGEPPGCRTDFPHIVSYGDQARQDKKMLHKGSVVMVRGSIQARGGYKIKPPCACRKCGNLPNLKGKTLEIVPYSVEYFLNYNMQYGISTEEDW